MLGQRHRRWPSIELALNQRPMLAVLPVLRGGGLSRKRKSAAVDELICII